MKQKNVPQYESYFAQKLANSERNRLVSGAESASSFNGTRTMTPLPMHLGQSMAPVAMPPSPRFAPAAESHSFQRRYEPSYHQFEVAKVCSCSHFFFELLQGPSSPVLFSHRPGPQNQPEMGSRIVFEESPEEALERVQKRPIGSVGLQLEQHDLRVVNVVRRAFEINFRGMYIFLINFFIR